MPVARNDPQTLAMFTPPLVMAMNTTARLIFEANEGIVQEVVYNKGGGGKIGGRTYDLKRAWDTNAWGGQGKATGEFKYNPGKMNYHRSVVEGGGVQGGLIYIVYQGLAGNFGWPPVGPAHAREDYRFAAKWWAGPRNAWAELCHFLGKTKIRQFFEKGMASSGLRFASHGGSIGMKVYDNG